MNETKKRWQGLGGGIYQDSTSKKFYHRPTVNGRPTFRLLDVANLTKARELKARLDGQQTMHEHGLDKDPYAAPPATIGELAQSYLAAGCPMKNNQKREGVQLIYEQNRLTRLLPFWKDRLADKIKPKDCLAYAEQRRIGMREGSTGGRSIDMELITLTAVFSWAVLAGRLDFNPLLQRPKFHDGKKVRHCRECMPRNAQELHDLASKLFQDPRSESLGWQLLLEAMTGCRTNEILRLRWDAQEFQAGHVSGNHLWLARSKNGTNPFVEIHPALAEALEALRLWRIKRELTKSPWFIPGRSPAKPADKTSLTHALARLSKGGQHRTSHGLRAYYVTVRRSMGISDNQIAGEIGDRSGAAIVLSTYGAVPPNWQGGKELGWLVYKRAWEVLALPTNLVQIPPG